MIDGAAPSNRSGSGEPANGAPGHRHYIGLMSGTSVDGIDGVLVAPPEAGWPRVLAHVHHPFDAALRAALLALNTPGDNELHRAALAAGELADGYAGVVDALLAATGLSRAAIAAIGAHGQTVRHRPGTREAPGYTIQLLNGARLAERCGIDVVCDLRSRDVAAGGQGAPLVPAVHDDLFAADDQDVAVLNLGGIANLSLLPARRDRPGRQVTGWDTGPANALLDAWCERHTGAPYDAGGAWAAQGQVLPRLLAACLAEPFFAAAPPKSTGRDLFDLVWLGRLTAAHAPGARPVDVQATLAELTAASVAMAMRAHAPAARRLLVCGGGARNDDVMARLRGQLPSALVSTTDAEGIPVDQVEALAFAWLARACVERRPGNLPAVTGAVGPRVLGARYPGA